MCKHEEILTAGRNALVSLRSVLPEDICARDFIKVNDELSRLENFYDWQRFENEDYECVLCNRDNHALGEKFGLQHWLSMTSWEQELERNRLVMAWERTLLERVATWGK